MTEQELIERLADKEHDSWGRWMDYLFTNCPKQKDGSIVISAKYREALQQLIDTPYAELTESDKQYDRDEVAHILPIIQRRITTLEAWQARALPLLKELSLYDWERHEESDSFFQCQFCGEEFTLSQQQELRHALGCPVVRAKIVLEESER